MFLVDGVELGANKTLLVRLCVKALIACESSKRLAKLGGTEKELHSIPRRRSKNNYYGFC